MDQEKCDSIMDCCDGNIRDEKHSHLTTENEAMKTKRKPLLVAGYDMPACVSASDDVREPDHDGTNKINVAAAATTTTSASLQVAPTSQRKQYFNVGII